MDTSPATYSDFLREMRTLCKPYGANMPKFERICEAMWYEGDLSSSSLARHGGVSRPTAIKWVNAAGALGLVKGVRRARSAAHEKEAAKERDALIKMTPEEMRAHYVSRLHKSFESAEGNPAAQTSLVSAIASLVPGLKAPETRLDVQILIGRDNTDRIEEGLAENLKWIMGNDRNFGLRLLEKAGLNPASLRLPAEEITDAEIAEVDDGAGSGGQPPSGTDDGGDPGVRGGR